MWYTAKNVIATHVKNGPQMAWALINGVGIPGWIRVAPSSVDGVSNVNMILSAARAHNRLVDVFIVNGQIEQATLC